MFAEIEMNTCIPNIDCMEWNGYIAAVQICQSLEVHVSISGISLPLSTYMNLSAPSGALLPTWFNVNISMDK